MYIMNTKENIRIGIVACDGITPAPADIGNWIGIIQNELEKSNKIEVNISRNPKTEAAILGLKLKLNTYPSRKSKLLAFLQTSRIIISSLFRCRVLFVYGITGAWLFPFVNVFTNRKIILVLNGIEWNNSENSLLTNWYLFWAETLAIQYSQVDIVENEAIQDYTSAHYGLLSKIIEPACAVLPKFDTLYHLKQEFPLLEKPFAFLEIKSNLSEEIHTVLKSFSMLNRVPLVIHTCAEESDSIQTFLKKHQHPSLFHLPSATSKHKALAIKSKANYYIWADTDSGTHTLLLEAISLGLTIIAFSNAYNRASTENKAYYFKNSDQLAAIISNCSAQELKEQSKLMLELANNRYNRNIIQSKYKNVFLESLKIRRKDQVIPRTAGLNYQKLLDLELAHLIKH